MDDFFHKSGGSNLNKGEGEQLFKIGQIAKKADVLPSTIRYYCNIGLLKVSNYSQGGYRLFREDETMERLKKIKELIDKRLTLEEIKRWFG